MRDAQRAAVVPADLGWSDVGSWDALWELGAKDADGNVAIGDVGNGDVWLARDALALGLVDELGVSDEYLYRARERASIYLVKSHEPKPFLRALLDRFGSLARMVV